MKVRNRWYFLLPALVLGVSVNAVAQEDAPPCGSAQHHQFDFWLGEWDLTWDEDGHGSNTINRILGDCIIQENFDGGASMPLRGMSVSAYHPATGQWLQTWVDNDGSYLDFTGGMRDGRMVLQRRTTREGREILQRMVWRDIKPDALEWDWEASTDGGATWTSNWQIHYRRKTPR